MTVLEMNAYTPMNPAAKKAWIKALRSGEYKQTRGQLCRSNGRMCCLGVVYDVAVDGEWDWNAERRVDVPYGPLDRGYGIAKPTASGVFIDIANLPDHIRTKVGIDDDAIYKLVDMNDDEKCSFSEIADWIETNL